MGRFGVIKALRMCIILLINRGMRRLRGTSNETHRWLLRVNAQRLEERASGVVDGC